jgi:hypothetical protein
MDPVWHSLDSIKACGIANCKPLALPISRFLRPAGVFPQSIDIDIQMLQKKCPAIRAGQGYREVVLTIVRPNTW